MEEAFSRSRKKRVSFVDLRDALSLYGFDYKNCRVKRNFAKAKSSLRETFDLRKCHEIELLTKKRERAEEESVINRPEDDYLALIEEAGRRAISESNFMESFLLLSSIFIGTTFTLAVLSRNSSFMTVISNFQQRECIAYAACYFGVFIIAVVVEEIRNRKKFEVNSIVCDLFKENAKEINEEDILKLCREKVGCSDQEIRSVLRLIEKEDTFRIVKEYDNNQNVANTYWLLK